MPNQQMMDDIAAMMDPTQLIEEVKLRPGLYNQEHNLDRSDKLELWKSVCAALFSDWETCSKSVMYDRVLTIQKKWRSLRDAYNRELRIRKKNTDNRTRRVYKYFKKMAFLGGFEGSVSEEEEGGDNEELFVSDNFDHESLPEEEKVIVKKNKKRKRRRQDTDTIQPTEEMEMPMFPIEITDDNDTDKYFLLSFLPEMRQLPLNLKMWARAQIANVMQEAVNSQFNNTKPNKFEIKQIPHEPSSD